VDGEYEPYGTEEAVELLAEMKSIVPEHVRIQRIQRDIPVPEIAAGILKSNLRQLVQRRMAEQGRKCRCLRCREVGHTGQEPKDPGEACLKIAEYEASGGTEHFISYESGDSVIGYVRLRTDGSGTAAIREMKVSGSVTPVSGRGTWQHRGYDASLIARAEEAAAAAGASRMRVTCGPGAREFYRDLGYELERPYMVKKIS